MQESKALRLIFKSRVVPSPLKESKVRETAVLVLEDEYCICHEAVRQHVIDQDCKFTGQKRAMEKLMQKYFLGDDFKEVRKALWRQFFLRSKQGRKILGEQYEAKVQDQVKN